MRRESPSGYGLTMRRLGRPRRGLAARLVPLPLSMLLALAVAVGGAGAAGAEAARIHRGRVLLGRDDAAAGAPVDLTRPQIYGRAQDGARVIASPGNWRDAASFSYRWRRCNAAGGSCTPIKGATSVGYTLTGADVGGSIGVQVIARNRYGSATAASVDDTLTFDGASAYVQVADRAGLRPETGNAFTVSFWVKLDSLTNNALPRFWEKGPDYMAVMGDPANRLFRHVGIEVQNSSGSGNANNGATEFWGSSVLQIGAWYHVVAVFDGSLGSDQSRIYINGVAETMRTISPWTGTLQPTAGADLYLARRHTDLARNLQGQMDSFVFYSRALSDSQVAELNAGLPPAGATLVYGFDEDGGTIAVDASGAGNGGAILGAVYTPLIVGAAQANASGIPLASR